MTATSGTAGQVAERRPNGWLRGPVVLVFSLIALTIPASRELFGTEVLYQVVALDFVLLVFLLLGYVARPPHRWLWLTGAVLVPGGALISGTNSSLSSSLLIGVSLAVMFCLVPAVLARLHHDAPSAPRRIVQWFVVGQTVSAAVGVAQLAGLEVGAGLIFGRATGLAGHPNTLGLMGTLALIACFAGWARAGGIARLGIVLLIALNGVAVVATGSLSAMLAAVAALGFVVFTARKALGTLLTLIIGGSVAVAASQLLIPGNNTLLSSIGYRLAVVTGEGDGSGGAASLDVREQTYEWAWNWIDRSPIVGVGMDPSNAATFDGSTVVHSFILRGWYQGGLPVAAWLALLTGVVAAVSLRALVRGSYPWSLAGAIAVIAFAFTSAFLNQPSYWLPLLFALTFASGPQARTGGGTEASDDALAGHLRTGTIPVPRGHAVGR